MTTDARLTDVPGYYDFSLTEDGQIEVADFFDTSLLYSFFGEKRAAPEEVIEPQLRRGWIGNDDDYENGSKIWLLSQERLTRETLNRLKDEAEKCLRWLVDDGFAVSIDDAQVTLSGGKVLLSVVIRRSRDKVDRRNYVLWDNTGRAN